MKHFFRRLALILFASIVPLIAAAQENIPVDYEAWTLVAQRAEDSVDAARASNDAFEQLRSQVTGWRQTFLTAQETNATRVKALKDQLDALGPKPEGDQPPEAEDIALRRAELTEQIKTLEAPIIKAKEAFNRADSIITEIDRIIRTRQTSLLFEIGPSPLNPTNWPDAFEELSRSFNGLYAEVRESLSNPTQARTMQDRALGVIGLIILGLVLLLRGSSWAKALGRRLRRDFGVNAYLWQFALSLVQVALPLAGVFALSFAISYATIGGQRTLIVLTNLPLWFGYVIAGQWLAGHIFADDKDDAIYFFSHETNRLARILIQILTGLLAVSGAVSALAEYDNYPPEARAVLGFLLVLIASVFLFRLGQILYANRSILRQTGSTSFSLLPYVGRVIQLAALLAPVLAAIGYEAAANALLFPIVRTVGLIGLVLVLQRLVSEIFAAITGDESAKEALLPVLVGFLLILLALPLLALIWGARIADLSEVWTTIQQGVAIGESRISPTDFLAFILVFVVGYVLTRVLQGTLRTTILPKTRLDTGGKNAIVAGIGYVGITLAAVFAISTAGIDLSSIALVAGALSVGIGFGLQNIVSNFVSGIILLIERPISEGDWIQVGGQHGTVREISVRSTRVETFDRTDLIIPNSDLVSGQVINWTHGNSRGRVIIQVGVAYGTDTRKVESILRGIAEAHPIVSSTPAPAIYFNGFGASSLDFEIRAVLTDVNLILTVKSDINHEIAQRFTQEGIEIPFNHTDITIRNPEDLFNKGDKT